MAFDPEPVLVQFSIICGPGRRETAWVMYPGFPPLMHRFSLSRPILKPSGEKYGIEDLCWLLALDRLPRVYEAMSGHEKLAVRAAEEEARIALQALGGESNTRPPHLMSRSS